MKRKLFAGMMVFLTAVVPVAGSINVGAADRPVAVGGLVGEETEESANKEAPDGEAEADSDGVDDSAAASEADGQDAAVSVDKEKNLLNSAKVTDKIAEEKENENVMFSPTSLNFALGMLAQGAKGETAEALKNYLGTDDFAGYARDYLEKIKDYNIEEDEDSLYHSKLKIADAIWADHTLPLNENFQEKVRDGFDSEVNDLDFSNPKEACKIINEWCDRNTEGLIPEIITPDSINEDTGLCLTNSLYFESAWSMEPWELATEEEKFGDNGEKTLYMVSYGDGYYENEKATAFGRSYANGLTFVGILPKEEGEFRLADLDISGLLKSSSEYDEVYCKMPKLNFETSAKLSESLQSLGLENLFSSGADFSGITDAGTKVGSILQKTKLELDENGTKAAAITAIQVETCAAPASDPIIKEVNLTRPFAFLIYDSRNEEVLFMGKVVTVE